MTSPAIDELSGPVDAFVQRQIDHGVWREQVIPAEVVGLTRPLTVVRARRKNNRIVHKWHGDTTTFCPPMWSDLAIGSGACGLRCSACFLMLTFRVWRDPSRHLLYDNIHDFVRAAEQWLRDPARRFPHTLGVGIDRSDSLLYEGETALVRQLAPVFASRANRLDHRLVLLTKSANTRYLADIPVTQRGNIVVSFSLNPQEIADLWEGRWPDGERVPPTIARRLQAAREAQDLGFDVRIRLDPILTPPGWEEIYAAFIGQVRAARLCFSYWTLGTYREKNAQLALWAEKWGLAPMGWAPEELTQDGTHRHLPEERRISIYTTVRDLIRAEFPQARVSLCKETHAVRRSADLRNAHCNCLR